MRFFNLLFLVPMAVFGTSVTSTLAQPRMHAATTLDEEPRFADAKVTDVELDGVYDLALADTRDSVVSIRQRVAGVWVQTVALDCPGVERVSSEDFDGDGWPDVAAFSSQLGVTFIYRNLGGAGFELSNLILTPADLAMFIGMPGCSSGIALFVRSAHGEILWSQDPMSDSGFATYTENPYCPRFAIDSDLYFNCLRGPLPSAQGHCSTTPTGPGTAACVDAAVCVSSDCAYSACQTYRFGGGSYLGLVLDANTCDAQQTIDLLRCAVFP